MRLLDFLQPALTVEDLRATDKSSVIEELLEVLRETKAFPRRRFPEVLGVLLEREKLGSTGVGDGVAVPHAKHVAVKKMTAVLGRSRKGVDFAALDGEAVYVVFLLISPVDHADDHLAAMQQLSALLRDRDYCRFIRQARDKTELVELLYEADERLQDS